MPASAPVSTNGEYLSYRAAGALVGKSSRTIRRWAKERVISSCGLRSGRKIVKSSLLAYNLSLEVTAQTPDAFKAQRLNEGNQAALLKFLEPLVRAILLQEMKGLDGSLNAQARRAQRGEEVPAVRPGLDSIPGTARTGAENLGSAPAPAVRLSDEEVAA